MIREFPGIIATRVVEVAPSSYDETSRTVDCVISMGSPVSRFYGTEVLRIHPDAVDTSRVLSGACPVLDSHQQTSITHALGRVTDTWFNGGAFMGRLAFNATDKGRDAEGMVARGEIAGVSAGYRVTEWQVTDRDGSVLDPAYLRWDDDDLTFEAVRWQLIECSLVSCPADAGAGIRLHGGGFDRALVSGDLSEDVRIRSLVKMRMMARQSMFEAQQAMLGTR